MRQSRCCTCRENRSLCVREGPVWLFTFTTHSLHICCCAVCAVWSRPDVNLFMTGALSLSEDINRAVVQSLTPSFFLAPVWTSLRCSRPVELSSHAAERSSSGRLSPQDRCLSLGLSVWFHFPPSGLASVSTLTVATHTHRHTALHQHSVCSPAAAERRQLLPSNEETAGQICQPIAGIPNEGQSLQLTMRNSWREGFLTHGACVWCLDFQRL